MGRRAVSVGKRSDERGEPHGVQGTFSVFEINNKKTHKKETQPRNTLKQLVCFIGVWEREENHIEDTIQGRSWCGCLRF